MKHSKYESIIKDAVIVLLVGGVILVTQFLFSYLVSRFNLKDATDAVSIFVTVLITFLIYRSYEKRISSILNKTWFKGSHIRRVALAHLNDDLLSELNLTAAATVLGSKYSEIFGVDKAVVFVRAPEEKRFVAVWQISHASGLDAMTVSEDDAIVHSMLRRRKYVFYKRSYQFMAWNDAVEVDAFFERYDARVVLPFFHRDALVGFMVLSAPTKPGIGDHELTDSYYALSKSAGQALSNALAVYLKAAAPGAGKTVEEQSVMLQRLKLEAIEKLATGVAHEIRNPLTIISLKTQRLASKASNGTVSNQELTKAVETIEEQVARAKDITSRLVKFARNDEHIQNIDIRSTMHELIDFLGYRTCLDKITMLKFIDPVMPFYPARINDLRELFTNILFNAVEAMQPDGGTVCVYMQYHVPTTSIVVHVIDNGRGVTVKDGDVNEMLPNPFYTTKQKGNPGLGLYVCQQIVQRYQGTITIESNQPQGTDVIVRLPLTGVIEFPTDDTQREAALQGREGTEGLLPLDIVKGMVFS